jgi:iron complex transport system ATP-binding protein
MPSRTTPTLACTGLTVRVPGRLLVEALELSLSQGDFLAVLGQNGAGKSLTLHALAGLRAPDAGEITLCGEPLAALRRKDVARKLALLPQYADDVFPTTVFDTALSGRHPHVPRLQWETASDRDIAARSLREMDLHELSARDVATLSGGERRRLAIAQVLTQAPEVYLLDEPTNHLDPQHQLDVLRVFSEKVRDGATVVASLHDVNLAARYADRCLLLFGNGRWTLGPVREVLNTDRLSELYATPMESITWRDMQLFVASGERRNVSAGTIA